MCVYGGTSAGIVAAVTARRLGRTVVVLEPSDHLGGLSAGGLGWTDFGSKDSIGGIAREFYRRLGRRYGCDEEWHFEPGIAETEFGEIVAETETRVHRREWLEAVETEDGLLTALRTENGLEVRAGMYIDATYEGDLMARAGVTYVVGRECNETYGENLNGAQIREKHQFEVPVDPYREEGVPASGLLPGIGPAQDYIQGRGDGRIQAYCFRMCLTREAGNRIPFPKPIGYNPACYELLARYFRNGWRDVFRKFDPIRNGKTDTNNHGAVSTDFVGMNYAYPNAGYVERERIFQAHVVYQQGLMWFLANDRRVPADIREEMVEWGLCRDEFPTTGGWSHALYVREARRMVADAVVTEHHCRGYVVEPDPVGMGAYGMDSHNCRRLVQNGRVWNEGDVQSAGFPPYPIPYRAIVPRRGECRNLLVPVCLSASHIAYGSVRMEPVFMVLGQSAATAAHLALAERTSVQELPYRALEEQLRVAGQVLKLNASRQQRNEIV